MSISKNINLIYNKLFNEYSYQGWWPIISYEGSNPTKTGVLKANHPGDYDFPRNSNEQFEIIIGAILTQNTSWPSVEKALINLNKLIDNFNPYELLNLAKYDKHILKEAIRPAGYYNQKTEYLINIADFYISLDNGSSVKVPLREELLDVKGIGNETADCILLYAFSQKEFVVDTYTKRIFSYLNYIDDKYNYLKIKSLFESNFKGSVNEYQEYHALIVEHAKRYYTKKPYGLNDKILSEFKI